MSMLRKGSLIAVLAALAALTVAVGAFAATSATAVTVTAGKPTEFKFTLSKKVVKKGIVSFKVTNKGMIAHDFKIAGKKTKSLKTGTTQTIKVTFKKAGKYPFICTLPGHGAAGMKGVLVVK